jgi:hypothetical protein
MKKGKGFIPHGTHKVFKRICYTPYLPKDLVADAHLRREGGWIRVSVFAGEDGGKLHNIYSALVEEDGSRSELFRLRRCRVVSYNGSYKLEEVEDWELYCKQTKWWSKYKYCFKDEGEARAAWLPDSWDINIEKHVIGRETYPIPYTYNDWRTPPYRHSPQSRPIPFKREKVYLACDTRLTVEGADKLITILEMGSGIKADYFMREDGTIRLKPYQTYQGRIKNPILNYHRAGYWSVEWGELEGVVKRSIYRYYWSYEFYTLELAKLFYKQVTKLKLYPYRLYTNNKMIGWSRRKLDKLYQSIVQPKLDYYDKTRNRGHPILYR